MLTEGWLRHNLGVIGYREVTKASQRRQFELCLSSIFKDFFFALIRPLLVVRKPNSKCLEQRQKFISSYVTKGVQEQCGFRLHCIQGFHSLDKLYPSTGKEYFSPSHCGQSPRIGFECFWVTCLSLKKE